MVNLTHPLIAPPPPWVWQLTGKDPVVKQILSDNPSVLYTHPFLHPYTLVAALLPDSTSLYRMSPTFFSWQQESGGGAGETEETRRKSMTLQDACNKIKTQD